MRARGHHGVGHPLGQPIPMLAALVLAGLTACQEAPSYRLRWVVAGNDVPSLTACADAGLFQVHTRTFVLPGPDEPNFEAWIRDERDYACHSAAFDGEGAVDGATLPPGEYVIQVRGVDRGGQPWIEGPATPTLDNPAEGRSCRMDPCLVEAPFCLFDRCYDGSAGDPCEDDGQCMASLRCNPQGECEQLTGCDPASGYDACLDDQLACDCQRLTVTPEGEGAAADGKSVEEGADHPIVLPTQELDAPPECVDGIDNDADGLVDGSDPACTAGAAGEGAPVGVTELSLQLTLLGRNAAATCSAVPLRRLRVTVGEGQAQAVVLEEACQLDHRYVALVQLPAGPAVFTVTGYDGLGTAASPAQPVTRPKVLEAEISEFGGIVARTIDFASADFLEPIEGSFRVSPSYVSEVGPGAKVRSSCAPPIIQPGTMSTPQIDRGRLTLDRLRVTVLDGHGDPLDAPVALADGTVLLGPTELPCTTELTSEPLAWGSYAVTLEALSAEGEVCFSNVGAPALLAPNGSVQGVTMTRPAYDATTPVPASCRDCEQDADCGLEDVLFCVQGVCQQDCVTNPDPAADPAEDDVQCESPLLGDLGFVCADDLCQPG